MSALLNRKPVLWFLCLFNAGIATAIAAGGSHLHLHGSQQLTTAAGMGIVALGLGTLFIVLAAWKERRDNRAPRPTYLPMQPYVPYYPPPSWAPPTPPVPLAPPYAPEGASPPPAASTAAVPPTPTGPVTPPAGPSSVGRSCPSCESNIPFDATYCPNCGNPVT